MSALKFDWTFKCLMSFSAQFLFKDYRYHQNMIEPPLLLFLTQKWIYLHSPPLHVLSSFLCFNWKYFNMFGKDHWANSKKLVSMQTMSILKGHQKERLLFATVGTSVALSSTAECWSVEVAIVTDTLAAYRGFIHLLCSCTWTFTLTQQTL